MNDHIRPIATVQDILNHNKSNGPTPPPERSPQPGYRTARKGKIARLPKAIREQLNLRLQDGLQAKPLAEWLNTLPEVNALMVAEFEGRKIREQNISEWRKGGYRDWLAQQEAAEMLERVNDDAAELQLSAQGQVGDKLAAWLAARYLVAAREITHEDGSMDWKRLRELTRDVVALRRGDIWSQRAQLERERFNYEQVQDNKDQQKLFWDWAMKYENRAIICKGFRTHDERLNVAGAVIFGDMWSTTDAEIWADQMKVARQALEAYEVGLAAGKAYLIKNNLPLPQSIPPFNLEAMLQQINARLAAEVDAAREAAGVVVPPDPYKKVPAEALGETPTSEHQAPVETPNTKIQTPKNLQTSNAENPDSQTPQPKTSKTPGQSDLLRPTPANGGQTAKLKAQNSKLPEAGNGQTAPNPQTPKPADGSSDQKAG